MDSHLVWKPTTCIGVTITGTTGQTLSNLPAGSQMSADIQIFGCDSYMRWDGSTPDGTGIDGSHRLSQSTTYTFEGRDLLSAMVFRPVSGSGWLNALIKVGE